ncbi:hypothetical protein PRK78_000864 [Emydomyces testavorans]|uniref:Uncharacterized protein n=1 Tax=Emydomyces testavorans TaxID=2070801 RepID=A0AAF0DBW4_9EURO|nr:hypothetical protein PRK78_000864 [Emydomyces testavorans]
MAKDIRFISIAGLLSSRAVLQGVGVGDASASPTAALLLNVLQESMGRIATILFAHRLGTSLEPECKMYRLAADIFNDSAMVMDCLSPMFPKPIRVGLLSLSSVLRALCGVAAGSSKASLSAHFAKWGNLAELNAVGSLVVSHITSPLATWVALILLLTVHLTTNYLAVHAVSMTTLNRQRANIVFSTLLDQDHTLAPRHASKHERIFEKDGVLRWRASSTILGSCQIGIPFHSLVQNVITSSPRNRNRTAKDANTTTITALLHLFANEDYILWFDPARRRAAIVLTTTARPTAQLKAWSHALLVAQTVNHADSRRRVKLDDDHDAMLAILGATLAAHSARFDGWLERLEGAGWDVHTPSLQTKPGRRFEVRKQE